MYKVTVLFLSALSLVNAALFERAVYEKQFVNWMDEYNMKFDGAEFVERLNVFADNHDFIAKHNEQGNSTFTLGHNQFSHMTFDEFQGQFLNLNIESQLNMMKKYKSLRYATEGRRSLAGSDEFDWVAKGAVTPVKNQGQCGSCYSFSALGALEGAYEIKTGDLKSFSEQNVVDCDAKDMGCNGGDPFQVYDFIAQQGGACEETSYPYAGVKATCQKCTPVPGSAPSTYVQVRPTENAMLDAVNTNPVSVAIAVSRELQMYSSGVFDGTCAPQLNHGVLTVGYGSDATGGDYWKVKNSWGTSWGENGFFRLSRASDKASCGMLEHASYPVLGNSVELTRKGNDGSMIGTDCGGSSITFDDFKVSPDQIQKNEEITETATGVLTTPVQSGEFKLTVTMGGTQVYSNSGDVCGESTFDLPLGAGHLKFTGLTCPANPGPVTVTFTSMLPDIAPSGTYDIKITAVDQDSTPLMCIDNQLSI